MGSSARHGPAPLARQSSGEVVSKRVLWRTYAQF